MPKIIFTSRYIKNATPAQGANLVNYMATREGVEALDEIINYVDYIAQRPGVECAATSGHGLWNGSDAKIVLSQAMDEVANHRGNLFTHVISLRREDAARLGYDNADAWRELVKSKLPVIAEAMKIPLGDLRWYAAFHNRASNPHIHLIIYSQNPAHSPPTGAGR